MDTNTDNGCDTFPDKSHSEGVEGETPHVLYCIDIAHLEPRRRTVSGMFYYLDTFCLVTSRQ